MSNYTIKKLPKHTLEVHITFTDEDIKKEYPIVFDTMSKEIQIEGFRKGKAPASVIKKYISDASIYEECLNKLLQEEYSAIVTKEKIEPVIKPNVTMKKGEIGKDWEFTLTTALKPTVKLPDIKKLATKIKENLKKDEEAKLKNAKTEDERKAATFSEYTYLNSLLDKLIEESSIEISPLLIDAEKHARMHKLTDDLQKVGMTMESYAKSRNTTEKELDENLTKDVENSYKMEYVLSQIASDEKIQVGDEDLQPLFERAKTKEQKQALQNQLYNYALMIQRQKVFDYLSKLA